MVEFPISVPTSIDWPAAILMIEGCCVNSRLLVIQRSSLAKYPGCTHWHFKRPKEKGTLELTVWPDQGKAWFIHRANRSAAWMDGAISQLVPIIEAELNRLNSKP